MLVPDTLHVMVNQYLQTRPAAELAKLGPKELMQLVVQVP